MIRKLSLKNFKPFKDLEISFNSLTLLSGVNSSGKSSILQSLLLLRQSYQQKLLPDVGLALNGSLVSLGNGQDLLCEYAKEDIIELAVTFDNDSGVWKFNYDRESDVISINNKSKVSLDIYKQNLFGDEFHYLQAERLGPRRFFEMSDFRISQNRQIGNCGEYTSHFLSLHQNEDIACRQLMYDEQTPRRLIDQVQLWMSEISPGMRIRITPNPDMDIVNLQYSYGLSRQYRATNVGFGITYTLPIIVAVLSSSPGTIVLVENPEAHLHPKGQAKMGELLARAASCGIQIVIETHSDHVLNGIRLIVHDSGIDPHNVQLHYFNRIDQGIDELVVEVISPRIDRNGRLDRWPDGFFDEWDKSLDALLEPARE